MNHPETYDAVVIGGGKGGKTLASISSLGTGRFLDPQRVEVMQNDGVVRQLTSQRIFIDTGTRPVIPDLPGLPDVPFLTTQRILGCTLLAEAGEMIGTVQAFMIAGMPATKLRDAVLSHPTMVEGFNALFAAL